MGVYISKIGIDARVLEKGITGIGRYLDNILEGLPYVDGKNDYYLFSYNDLGIRPEFYKNIATGQSFLPEKLFSVLWLNFVLPKYLKKYKIDIFFAPNHFLPLRNITSRTIIAVHDVAHKADKIYHPFFYRVYMSIFLPRSLRRSDRIITISEYSKDSIINNYRINKSKISVIYETANKKFLNKDLQEERENYLRRKYSLPQHFILYVGVIENRKNISGILKISDLIHEKNDSLEFVLIGRQGHGFNKFKKEILSREYVHYLDFIGDDELIDIYNMAFAFIFPSYLEGFGLPPLEAMQTGLPVLVSNRSSLPEVVGNSAIIKDPDDYKGFADELIKMFHDKKYYEVLKEKAYNRALLFNYNDSIKNFVSILNTTIE